MRERSAHRFRLALLLCLSDHLFSSIPGHAPFWTGPQKRRWVSMCSSTCTCAWFSPLPPHSHRSTKPERLATTALAHKSFLFYLSEFLLFYYCFWNFYFHISSELLPVPHLLIFYFWWWNSFALLTIVWWYLSMDKLFSNVQTFTLRSTTLLVRIHNSRP